MKIKIHRSKDNQFYWTIVASNGRTLATSETYKSKQSCIKSADLAAIGHYTGIFDTTK